MPLLAGVAAAAGRLAARCEGLAKQALRRSGVLCHVPRAGRGGSFSDRSWTQKAQGLGITLPLILIIFGLQARRGDGYVWAQGQGSPETPMPPPARRTLQRRWSLHQKRSATPAGAGAARRQRYRASSPGP